MISEINKYTYRVTWSEDDGEFLGLCAEFPSLSWLAETPEKSLSGIADVVKTCVDDLIKHDKEIPSAIVTRKYSGEFMVRVPPETNQHSVVFDNIFDAITDNKEEALQLKENSDLKIIIRELVEKNIELEERISRIEEQLKSK